MVSHETLISCIYFGTSYQTQSELHAKKGFYRAMLGSLGPRWLHMLSPHAALYILPSLKAYFSAHHGVLWVLSIIQAKK